MCEVNAVGLTDRTFGTKWHTSGAATAKNRTIDGRALSRPSTSVYRQHYDVSRINYSCLQLLNPTIGVQTTSVSAR